jgi:hypothetical protein
MMKKISASLMKTLFIIIAIILSINTYGQDHFYKHQFGINMGEFVPLFKTQTGNFDLNYYYHLNEKHHLRSGFSYKNVIDETGEVDFSARLGFGKRIRQFEKLQLYAASDVSWLYSKNYIDERYFYKVGLSLMMGIRYHFSKNISVSSEPGFFWYSGYSKRPNSFGSPSSTWQEHSIDNIGQLLISFHF